MIEHVDPFIGSSVTDLPAPQGLAQTWWWPKPQVGNTHPGATYPFGMVSACAYSGAYPTGYGRYDLSTEGVPRSCTTRRSHRASPTSSSPAPARSASTTTTSASPRWWSRSTTSATPGSCSTRRAEPGYYAATLELGHPLRDHRRPQERGPPLHVPGAHGRPAGHRLLAGRPGDPVRRDGAAAGAPRVAGTRGGPGARSSSRARRSLCTWSVTRGDWRQMLWYDRRLMPGGTRLDFDRIRPTTLRPFGLMWRGPTEPGQVLELRFGFSLRGVEQARRNLYADCGQEGRPSTAGAPRRRPSGGSTSTRSRSRRRRRRDRRSSPPRSTTR